jgi:membrane fusion protein (multidrug efflux system)
MNSPIADTAYRTGGLSQKAERKPRVWLRLLLVLLFVGLIGGGLMGFHQFKGNILKQVTKTIQSEVPTVATGTATSQPWQSTLAAVGSLRASSGADLAAELGGVVDAIHFESGQNVAAGAVLLKLRLNDDQAKLQQLQASADLAQINYDRDLRQLRVQGVSQATVDSDLGNLKAARSQVSAQQAVIDEKTIRAPFAGRLGVRQVDIGQYIAAGTAIVTLQALDPMFVDFYLPQQALAQIGIGQDVVVNVDAYPGRSFAGKITALNAKIDTSSRMLQIRASVANPDGALLPGMFATAVVATGAPQDQVTIPLAAVSYNPYGSLVYVVQNKPGTDGAAEQTVRQQFITTGASRGDQVSVSKGLAAGDVIVTAGQMKLHNGAAIKVNNAVQVTNDATPAPQDH